MKFGKQVTLSGVIVSSQNCTASQTVRIERAPEGGGFTQFGTTTSSSNGSYSFNFTADQNATYRAVAQQMHALIAEQHPAVAAAMTHVDTDAEPRLERILSEMRTERKRAALR